MYLPSINTRHGADGIKKTHIEQQPRRRMIHLAKIKAC